MKSMEVMIAVGTLVVTIVGVLSAIYFRLGTIAGKLSSVVDWMALHESEHAEIREKIANHETRISFQEGVHGKFHPTITKFRDNSGGG